MGTSHNPSAFTGSPEYLDIGFPHDSRLHGHENSLFFPGGKDSLLLLPLLQTRRSGGVVCRSSSFSRIRNPMAQNQCLDGYRQVVLPFSHSDLGRAVQARSELDHGIAEPNHNFEVSRVPSSFRDLNDGTADLGDGAPQGCGEKSVYFNESLLLQLNLDDVGLIDFYFVLNNRQISISIRIAAGWFKVPGTARSLASTFNRVMTPVKGDRIRVFARRSRLRSIKARLRSTPLRVPR